MTLNEVIDAILGGVADDQEDLIYDAIKQRRKLTEQRKRLNFRVGDKVVFNDLARPTYLRGIQGTIKKINQTRVVVKIGADGGRFANSSPSTPISIIDKVPA